MEGQRPNPNPGQADNTKENNGRVDIRCQSPNSGGSGSHERSGDLVLTLVGVYQVTYSDDVNEDVYGPDEYNAGSPPGNLDPNATATYTPLPHMIGSQNSVAIPIRDSTPAPASAPELSITDATAFEAAGELVFDVSLSAAATEEIIVLYRTADPSAGNAATAGSDYTAFPRGSELTFAVDEQTKQITVPIAADSTDGEGDEVFELILSYPFNARLSETEGEDRGIGTIRDGDLGFELSGDMDVGEAAGNVVLTVTLNEPQGEALTVEYATSDGTATAGTDYTTTSGTLNFAAGDTVQVITVPITNDDRDDSDDRETFTVTLSNESALSIRNATATITIVDDDDPPTLSVTGGSANESARSVVFTVNLSGPSERMVAVDYATMDGTAEAGTDYTAATGTLEFAPGELQQNVTVAIMADADDNVDTFTLNLSNPRYASFPAGSDGMPQTTLEVPAQILELTPLTLAADVTSVMEGGSVVFTLTAATADSMAVTVPLTITPPAGFTFSPAAPTEQVLPADALTANFTLTIADNNRDQDDSSFTVAIGTLVPPASASHAAGSPSSQTITVEDNDGEPTLRIISPAGTLRESQDTEAVFTVILSATSDKVVTVEYATANGEGPTGATAGDDYTATSGTLTFEAGTSVLTAQVRVPLLVDADTVAETFSVALSNAENAGLAPNASSASATINELIMLSLSADATSVMEGENIVFTLTAAMARTMAVTVPLTVSAPTGFAFNPAAPDELVLPADALTTSLTLSIVDNARDQDDSSFTAAITDPDSGANDFYELAPGLSSLSIAVEDNDDAPAVTITPPAGELRESRDTEAVFTVTLSGASDKVVTVAYATADGEGSTGATAGDDYTHTSGTLTFTGGAVSASVPVRLLADADTVEETFWVVLSEPGNARLGDPSRASVTVQEGLDETDIQALNEAILPVVAASIADQGADFVRARAERAFGQDQAGAEVAGFVGPDVPRDGLTIRGATPAQFFARELRHSLANRELSRPEVAVHDLEFSYTLNAQGDDSASDLQFSGISVWGKGFYRDLSIEDDVPFDGTISGSAIGLDFMLRDDMLLGLSFNRATAEMDWQLPARDFTGQHETEVTGFHPYFAWSPGEDQYVWATLGRYSGDIAITEDRQAEAEIKQDVDITNYAMGARYHFWRSGSTPALSMSLIGDISSTTAEETSENSAEVSSTRVRVGIDLDHTGRIAAEEGADSTIDSGGEVTWRQDLGDGLNGGGLEVGGGLAINVPNYGLRLDLNARFLLIHSVDAEEWAIDGGLSWAKSTDGSGLSLQFSPQWGATTTSTRNHLWSGLTGDSTFGGYGTGFGSYGPGYGGYGGRLRVRLQRVWRRLRPKLWQWHWRLQPRRCR